MEIRALQWRRANIDKLWEHGISVVEVEWVVDHEAWVSYVDEDYPDQARIVGPTERGRFITVVMTPTRDPARWRPVTGWDSAPVEREYYRENYR